MSYETSPPVASGEEAPDETAAPDRIGAAYIDYTMTRAPGQDAAQRLSDIYQRHGTAFAIYLTLEDVDPYHEEAETHFQNSYLGTYPDRTDLIDETIETFGWEQSLHEYLGPDPLLRAMVRLEPTAIWNYITQHFDVTEVAGRLYVYERAP